jgi:hypothetical protein
MSGRHGSTGTAVAVTLTLAALLGGCTPVTQLRDAKTGETATCGGEIRSFESSARDARCLAFFHKQGFEPVSRTPGN